MRVGGRERPRLKHLDHDADVVVRDIPTKVCAHTE
jgi:hypothetical protein